MFGNVTEVVAVGSRVTVGRPAWGLFLFVGPIVLAVLVATITAFDEECDALADGTGA
jgi:hypothetical protein